MLLPVVWPLVFHTGAEPWNGPSDLSQHFQAPPEYQRLIPPWKPLFFDLAARTPEELLGQPGEWSKAMAVVRAEHAERDEFTSVFRAALAQLESLAERDKMRWQEMLWFLLSYAVQRRPDEERTELYSSSLASHHGVALKEEVSNMPLKVKESYSDWAKRHFTAIGRDEGRQEGRQEGRLMTLRAMVQGVFEQRFSPLPEALPPRIANATDADRLEAVLLRAHQVQSLEELDL